MIFKKTLLLLLTFCFAIPIYGVELPHPKPLMRKLEFAKERESEGGELRERRIEAIKQSEKMRHELYGKSPELMSAQPEWNCTGPFNISGRIRSIVVHPTNPGQIYIGAAAGGVWKTHDNGVHWTPLFDFENSISFGSLALDPVDPEIIYAATGEMIIGGGISYLGSGVYRSSNGGKNWDLIGLADVGAFSKIYIHPLDRNLIIAGGAESKGGLYLSEDMGKNWNRLITGNVTDISLNPTNRNEMFIAVNGDGVYHTSNLGENWTKKSSGITNIGGRISVQASASDFSIVYALVERSNSRAAIFKSTDRGNEWNMVHDGDHAFFRGQGFYNNYLAVHPTNPNIVLAGGIDLWRTANGGNSWQSVSDNTQSERMHVDNHHAAFSPINPNIVYNATDGGIYMSSDAGISWKDINANLAITQFYAISTDLMQPYRDYGGTQDNGTIGNRSDEWGKFISGDGFDLFLHPDNANILFGELYYGQIFKYKFNTSGKNDLNFLYENIPAQDSGIWHSPFLLDKKFRRIFLGLHAIYISYDFGDTFFPISQRNTHQYTAIAFSELDAKILLAGNRIGQIFRTSDSGKEWHQVNAPPMPRRTVTEIKFSKKDRETAYATFSGYGKPHLFKTTDLGASWFDIGSNLPDVPLNDIELHPNNENIIFVATDIGVYASYDGGGVWFPYGHSLSRSPVIDLLIHDNTALFPQMKLRAGTHGRSIWEADIVELPQLATEITSPAGGENLIGTTNFRISWSGFRSPVDIFVRFGEDQEWTVLASGVYGNSILWTVPDIVALTARISISSSIDGTSRISNSFSIKKLEKGAILRTGNVSIASYGIVHDGGNSLWVTDFGGNQVHKVNLADFTITKSLTLPYSEFYTDITINESKDLLYLHRLNQESGNGGKIITIDTIGNFIREFATPATSYPIGLAYSNGDLFVAERDVNRRIFRIDAQTAFVKNSFKNPFNNTFGPRGMTFYEGNLYQVSTLFVANALNRASALVFSPSSPTEIISDIPLSTTRSYINARGIDVDPHDYSLWICDVNGNIYNIANDKSLTSVSDNFERDELYIVPNPVNEHFSLSYLPKQSGTYSFELIDLTGVIRMTQSKYLQGNEATEILFRISKLSKGLYFIRINRDRVPIRHEKVMVIN